MITPRWFGILCVKTLLSGTSHTDSIQLDEAKCTADYASASTYSLAKACTLGPTVVLPRDVIIAPSIMDRGFGVTIYYTKSDNSLQLGMLWSKFSGSRPRAQDIQVPFSIANALNICERELDLEDPIAAEAGEQTPLFTITTTPRDPMQTATGTSLIDWTQPVSTTGTPLIDWTQPVRLPSHAPMETWAFVQTSHKAVGPSPYSLSSRRGVAQLEESDFSNTFQRVVHDIVNACKVVLIPGLRIAPFLMLPFGFWALLGLLAPHRYVGPHERVCESETITGKQE
jgi:hypothetical protein